MECDAICDHSFYITPLFHKRNRATGFQMSLKLSVTWRYKKPQTEFHFIRIKLQNITTRFFLHRLQVYLFHRDDCVAAYRVEIIKRKQGILRGRTGSVWRGEGGREEERGGEMSLFSMWEKLKSDECFDKCVITLNYRWVCCLCGKNRSQRNVFISVL